MMNHKNMDKKNQQRWIASMDWVMASKVQLSKWFSLET